MLITQNEYDLIFKGYYINGVAVRDTGHIYFTIREKREDIDPVIEEHLANKIFVSFSPTKPHGKQWGGKGFNGMNKIFSSVITRPLSQYIGVDMDGEVYVLGSGVSELEEPIPEESVIHSIRAINGRAYVAGSARYVARRVDRNNWEVLRKGIKKPTRDEYFNSAGFNCLDGFSESDIYAAGNHFMLNGEDIY